MSFSLCIAFTYCTDDLVQGNDEGIHEFESKWGCNIMTKPL